MKRFCIHCVVLLAHGLALAATNFPPATALLLDDNTSFGLTADLKQYKSVPGLSGKLTSSGSGITTILINRWAAEFSSLYPGVELDVHGGGTAGGLPALLEGKAELVPSGRTLPADEIERFKAKFGYEPVQITVAQDAVGIYVNKENPIAGLTLAQLDAIFSRDAKRGGGRPEFWRDVGVTGPLANKQIDQVSLNRLSDSYLFFRDEVMQGADYRFDVRFEPVVSSLVQAAGADNGAICFASVMFATARTRFVPLQARDGPYLLPSYENALSGAYPLTRTMSIVFNRKPDGGMNPVAREFLRFAVSRRGQRIIALAGSYPLTVEQQQRALRAIGGSP